MFNKWHYFAYKIFSCDVLYNMEGLSIANLVGNICGKACCCHVRHVGWNMHNGWCCYITAKFANGCITKRYFANFDKSVI
jgi:hypothetical protein